MVINVVRIGNSQGIRLPKALLETIHAEKKLDVEVENNKIILRPVHSSSRQDWSEKFKQMHKKGEDKLLMHDVFDDEDGGWEW
jgi:antitoxin MazE